MDFSALLALLADPKVLALVAPLLTELVDKLLVVIPNPLKPVVAIVVGALGAALGGTGVAAGAAAGLAGVGVAELATHAKAAVTSAPAAK
jgi:Na+/H+ antiporter NhaD/arsenite permease-like protein